MIENLSIEVALRVVRFLALHIYLLNHSVVGVAPYCAYDIEQKQWYCNYETAHECYFYNDYCAERED